MRFKRHMELEHGLKQIDIIPLINIVFLLLIFFMLTSSFVIQPGVRVNVPRVVTSEAAAPQSLELVVSAESNVYSNGHLFAEQELKELLALVARRKQPVLIRADRGAGLGRVVEICDLCRSLGVTQVTIATQ